MPPVRPVRLHSNLRRSPRRKAGARSARFLAASTRRFSVFLPCFSGFVPGLAPGRVVVLVVVDVRFDVVEVAVGVSDARAYPVAAAGCCYFRRVLEGVRSDVPRVVCKGIAERVVRGVVDEGVLQEGAACAVWLVALREFCFKSFHCCRGLGVNFFVLCYRKVTTFF